jgi:hypothetical protein
VKPAFAKFLLDDDRRVRRVRTPKEAFMKITRTVLGGFFAAFSLCALIACSSSSSGSGGDGGTTATGDGSTGNSSADPRCKISLCPAETTYDYSTSQCDGVRSTQTKAGCISQYDAYRSCVQTNEKCTSTGEQDRTSVKTACASTQTAWASCSSGDGG